MIKELSDLGKRLREEQRKQNKLIHNAIKDESMGIDLLIHEDGSFDSFLAFPRKTTQAEAITAKKGKARLLLDKAEEVLCYKDDSYFEDLQNNQLAHLLAFGGEYASSYWIRLILRPLMPPWSLIILK